MAKDLVVSEVLGKKNTVQVKASSTALTICSSRSVATVGVPGLGDLESYITAVNAIPMLTAEEEQTYAKRLQKDGDITAAQSLVNSHLRLVVSTARGYLGYGLPHADLIQEGNVGLMRAVKRFDPEKGVRLVSYAMYWIKASIHEYILKNWRLVKVSASRAQKKLFFKLRSYQNNFEKEGGERATVKEIAESLDVSEKSVVEMQERFSAPDVSYDTPSDGEKEGYGAHNYLCSEGADPFDGKVAAERKTLENIHLRDVVQQLDERSRFIVESRWLSNDDSGRSSTLHDLAAKLSISAERVRQIEVAALKKMRQALAKYQDLVV